MNELTFIVTLTTVQHLMSSDLLKSEPFYLSHTNEVTLEEGWLRNETTDTGMNKLQ